MKCAHHKAQLDCKKRCMKKVACLHIVEDLEMEVEEFVLNSLGNEEP